MKQTISLIILIYCTVLAFADDGLQHDYAQLRNQVFVNSSLSSSEVRHAVIELTSRAVTRGDEETLIELFRERSGGFLLPALEAISGMAPNLKIKALTILLMSNDLWIPPDRSYAKKADETQFLVMAGGIAALIEKIVPQNITIEDLLNEKGRSKIADSLPIQANE